MVRAKPRDHVTMNYDLPIDEHYAVGPVVEMYDHGPVTQLTLYGDEDGPGHGPDIDAQLYVCLDCGYVTHDNRQLLHEECDRTDNPVNQTWRERLEADDNDET